MQTIVAASPVKVIFKKRLQPNTFPSVNVPHCKTKSFLHCFHIFGSHVFMMKSTFPGALFKALLLPASCQLWLPAFFSRSKHFRMQMSFRANCSLFLKEGNVRSYSKETFVHEPRKLCESIKADAATQMSAHSLVEIRNQFIIL